MTPIASEQGLSIQSQPNKEEVKSKNIVSSIVKRPYYNNICFRMFIWRDLIDELKREKPLFGFDFGRPFRSVSLEILGWGESEWLRDGWISMHNSYLDIVYRAGILGLLFVASFITTIIIMVRRFFHKRSLKGVFLFGILVYWFVAANFGEVLELPYTAIPVWSLFGAILAYANDKRT